MRPNDVFRYVKNNQLAVDYLSLTRFYLPVIGREALVVYQYLLAFWDDKRSNHTFTEILNHLDMGWQLFEKALEQLIALRLLDIYQQDGEFQLELHPNLSAEEFLTNHVYRNLLEQKIGESAVEKLVPEKPLGIKKESSFLKFLEEQIEQAPVVKKSRQDDFNLTDFKKVMARDGLRFEDEKSDLIVLFQIAEQQKWTWYETYLLAKETAISQTISTKRMQEKLRVQKVVPQTGFSEREQTIIREAKRKTSLQFLAEMKQARKASITQDERTILKKMAELGLLDEVINIIVLLTFNKVDSANLNEKYAIKVANDFAYQEVGTAEQAVLRIRERNQEQPKRQIQQSQTSSRSNVPEWSQPHYKNTTSEQEKEEMERRAQELFAKLDKEGD